MCNISLISGQDDIEQVSVFEVEEILKMLQNAIELKDKTVLAVGPINDQMDKLILLDKLYDSKKVLVFMGDLCFPFNKTEEVITRLREFQNFVEGKNYFYVMGDKDLIFMKKIYSSHHDTYRWLATQPKFVRFMFPNNTALLMLHGGILSKHKALKDIATDLEASFVNGDPNSPDNWHKAYQGQFGYVLASHPATSDNTVKIYKYSASLDTNCHSSKVLAVQEFTKDGLAETIYI